MTSPHPPAGNGPYATGARRRRGFAQAGSLVSDQLREAAEKRGFAVARLLTQWAEVAGSDIAALAQPVKVSYGREGFGATLTVLCTGAAAPLVEMRAPALRDRVNACYGYNAISRIRITQTSATALADRSGAAPSTSRPAKAPPALSADAQMRLSAAVAPIENDAFRQALELLGRNIMIKNEKKETAR